MVGRKISEILSDIHYQYIDVWIESGGLIKPDSSESGILPDLFFLKLADMIKVRMELMIKRYFIPVIFGNAPDYDNHLVLSRFLL